MDDDNFSQLGLDFDSPIKRVPPVKGRRANKKPDPNPTKAFEVSMSPTSGIFSSPEVDGPPHPPPRSHRMGGWADDMPTRAATAVGEKSESRRFSHEDSDTDIPVIPDLEDVREEDLAVQMAQAPTVPVHRVATFQELDTDLMKHAAFATLDGIDLRPLSRFLASKNEIVEDGVIWTWDVLFTDVSSDLNAEWDQNGSAKGDPENLTSL